MAHLPAVASILLLLGAAGNDKPPGATALEAVKRGFILEMVKKECANGVEFSCKTVQLGQSNPSMLNQIFVKVIVEAQDECRRGEQLSCDILRHIDDVAEEVIARHRLRV